jgi:hypothetical protein
MQCRPEGATVAVAMAGALPVPAPTPAPTVTPFTGVTAIQMLEGLTPPTAPGVPPAGPGSGPP